MRISQHDIDEYARWSGDSNPVHVDPVAAKNSAYGATIVHGTLSTSESLRDPVVARDLAVSTLDIEFRGELRPDHEYQVSCDANLPHSETTEAESGSMQCFPFNGEPLGKKTQAVDTSGAVTSLFHSS